MPKWGTAASFLADLLEVLVIGAFVWAIVWWCSDHVVEYPVADGIWLQHSPETLDPFDELPIYSAPGGGRVEYVSWKWNAASGGLLLYYRRRQPAGWIFGRPAKYVFERDVSYDRTGEVTRIAEEAWTHWRRSPRKLQRGG